MDTYRDLTLKFHDLIRFMQGDMFLTTLHRGIYGLRPVEIYFNFNIKVTDLDKFSPRIEPISGEAAEIATNIINKKFDKMKIMAYQEEIDTNNIIIDSSGNYLEQIDESIAQIIEHNRDTIIANSRAGKEEPYLGAIWVYILSSTGLKFKGPDSIGAAGTFVTKSKNLDDEPKVYLAENASRSTDSTDIVKNTCGFDIPIQKKVSRPKLIGQDIVDDK